MSTRQQPIVTRGPWGVSTTSGCGIDGYEISVYRCLDGKQFRDGKYRIFEGQLYGRCVATSGEADRLCLEYGYSQPFSRNSCKFVMSRSARKRGVVSTDPSYLRKAAERCERCHGVKHHYAGLHYYECPCRS